MTGKKMGQVSPEKVCDPRCRPGGSAADAEAQDDKMGGIMGR